LYCPESTPEVTQTNQWNQKNFEGPMGLLSSGLARAVTSGGDGLGQAGRNVAGAVGQGILGKIAEQAGMSASQLTALKGGEVYNPNIELLYSTPVLRTYTFQFSFFPSTDRESRNVRDIIRTFKKWSAPKESNDMFEVPRVWKIKYRQPDMMGKFKMAALTSVTMQANPSAKLHTTFGDGMPVEYALGLAFKEVDIITQKDHKSGVGY